MAALFRAAVGLAIVGNLDAERTEGLKDTVGDRGSGEAQQQESSGQLSLTTRRKFL